MLEETEMVLFTCISKAVSPTLPYMTLWNGVTQDTLLRISNS